MKIFRHPVLTSLLFSGFISAHAEEPAPHGIAKTDMHEYPTIDAVFDVNYDDPQDLNILACIR